jgi:hypothetical protein
MFSRSQVRRSRTLYEDVHFDCQGVAGNAREVTCPVCLQRFPSRPIGNPETRAMSVEWSIPMAQSVQPGRFGHSGKPDEAWLAKQEREPILEPELPIIDTHHYL